MSTLKELNALAYRLEEEQPHLNIVFEAGKPVVRGEW